MKVRDILKTENIIRISSYDLLSTALAKLSTSHDAAFVFSPEQKFLGVINPYYCLIKSSYPGNARVEHCLYHPPKIKTNFPLEKVAQLMIESKVHYLPVFDEQDVFIGIVSARHLLTSFTNTFSLKIKIKEILKTKKTPVVTVFNEDSIANALTLFKANKISKLVVINKDMKLEGILSHYDLISFLIAPKHREERGDRAGVKTSLTHQRVKTFAKSYVLTISKENYIQDALKMILEKKIGSVVIVDNERHPIGIITTRDLLAFLLKAYSSKEIEIVNKNLSKESRRILGGFFTHLQLWIKKIPNLSKAKLIVKEEKSGGLFKVILSLFPKKGKLLVIKKEGKNLLNVLKWIKKD